VSLVTLTTSRRQQRHVRQTWWLGYLAVVVGGLGIAGLARRRVSEPWLGLSLALVLVLLLGWLIRPRATLYAVLFLTAISDQATVWWFPFVKNFSSRESISFLADAATFSPLELALYLGCAISVIRRYAATDTLLAPTPLNRPLLVFMLFVVYGFALGLYSGADARIAVLEGRALFYVLLTFIIVVHECTEERHFRFALWSIVGGVVVQSLLSIQYLVSLDMVERDELERLNEHGSSLGHVLLIVAFLGFLLFGVRRPWVKLALIAGLVPTVYVFFVGQRRAGVAALVVAGVLIAAALFSRRRRAFWAYVPIVSIALSIYVAAFWNSTSGLAFPAQAIKGIIAPGEVSAADQRSDLYRLAETFNVNFTIRANPIRGLGFGRRFFRPIGLPNINFFELNEYLPHNSILWVWIKVGFFGFVACLYTIAKALMVGADRLRRLATGTDYVVTLAAVMFVAMFAMYSWVDISWDARNTVFLGFAMALCARSVPDRPTTAETSDESQARSDDTTSAMASA
jgi:O-antigen ligase